MAESQDSDAEMLNPKDQEGLREFVGFEKRQGRSARPDMREQPASGSDALGGGVDEEGAQGNYLAVMQTLWVWTGCGLHRRLPFGKTRGEASVISVRFTVYVSYIQ